MLFFKIIKNYFALIFLIVAIVPQLHAQQPLSIDDIVSIQTVTTSVINPAGTHVAYSLSVPPAEDANMARSRSHLLIMEIESGEQVRVTTGAGNPHWNADGRLFFTHRNTEHHPATQVYAVDSNASNLSRITNADHGVNQYTVSADGTTIAYTSTDPESPERAEMRELGYDMIVYSDDPRSVRMFVQPVSGGNSRSLTPDGWLVQDMALSPNGRQAIIRVTDNPLADYDLMFSELYRVNIQTGQTQLFTATEGKLDMITYSPDGSRVAFLGAKVFSDPLPQRIWIANADGSNKRDITPDDYVGTPEWIHWEDNNTILFAALQSTTTALNRISANGGSITEVIGSDAGILRSASFANDGNRFTAAINTNTHPGEVFVGSKSDGTVERVTFHNEFLNERSLGRQVTIRWNGADDKHMEGVLIYPVGYTEGIRYPLTILPHGGPEGTSLDGWNTRALYPVQLLAGEGYVVFKPNYRGSGGRGSSFTMANHRDLGGKEFEDVLFGIDYLEQIGLIDPTRVGISGTSYGGYFAAWAGTRYSDRFAAAITFAGLSNWISFTGTTDIPVEMSLTHWDLWWFDNPGQYMDRSPIAHLNFANTPILVATGLADERVHPEQAIQLYNFLRLLDIPTDLILYPRQPHGLIERAHQIHFMEQVVNWFNTYLD